MKTVEKYLENERLGVQSRAKARAPMALLNITWLATRCNTQIIAGLLVAVGFLAVSVHLRSCPVYVSDD